MRKAKSPVPGCRSITSGLRHYVALPREPPVKGWRSVVSGLRHWVEIGFSSALSGSARLGTLSISIRMQYAKGN
jgi:hypothetical protein